MGISPFDNSKYPRVRKTHRYSEDELQAIRDLITDYYTAHPPKGSLKNEANFIDLAGAIDTLYYIQHPARKGSEETIVQPKYLYELYNKIDKSKSKAIICIEAIRAYLLSDVWKKNSTNTFTEEQLIVDTDKTLPIIDAQIAPIIDEINNLLAEGLFTEAKKEYEQAKLLCNTLPDKYTQAVLKMCYWEILKHTNGSYSEQRKTLEWCLPVFKKYYAHEYLMEIYMGLLMLADDFLSVNRYGKALVIEAKKSHNDFEIAWAHYSFALELYSIGKMHDMLKQLDLTIEKASALMSVPDNHNILLGKYMSAKCYLILCNHYCDIGSNIEARAYSVKALKMFKDSVELIEDMSEMAVLFYYMARIEIADGNYTSEKCTTSIQSAKEIFEKAKDYEWNIRILDLELRVHIQLGHQAEVLKILQETRGLIKELSPEVAIQYVKIFAEHARNTNNIEEAIDYFDDLFAIGNNSNEKDIKLTSLNQYNPLVLISLIKKDNGLYRLLEDCLAEYGAGTEAAQCRVLHQVAYMYMVLNQLQKSLTVYLKLLEIYPTNDIEHRATVLTSIGDIYTRLENLDLSLEYHKEACKIISGSIFYDQIIFANAYYSSVLIYVAEQRKMKSYVYEAESCINTMKYLIREYKITRFDNDVNGIELLLQKTKKQLRM